MKRSSRRNCNLIYGLSCSQDPGCLNEAQFPKELQHESARWLASHASPQ